MTLGPAVGTLFCGGLMATYGWRPVFVVLGFASLLTNMLVVQIFITGMHSYAGVN